MKSRKFIIIVVLLAVTGLNGMAEADNYVNWKGGFWLSFPPDWEKINYNIVDHYLAMTDTARDIFNYEAVFAPEESQPFLEDAYLVITYEPTGKLSEKGVDSLLDEFAEVSFGGATDPGAWDEFIPGEPKVDYDINAISAVSEMAYGEAMKRKLWLYVKHADSGLVSLYFYSLDSTFENNRKVFEDIKNSLSFENLREAAKREIAFSDVGGENIPPPETETSAVVDESEKEAARPIISAKNIIMVVVVIVILGGIVWNFAIAPRRKNRKTDS